MLSTNGALTFGGTEFGCRGRIPIAQYPPHKTVRALLRIRLPPWMCGVKALHRITGNWAGPKDRELMRPNPEAEWFLRIASCQA